MKPHVISAFVLWAVLTAVGEVLASFNLFPVVGSKEAEDFDFIFRFLMYLGIPVFTMVISIVAYSLFGFRHRGTPTEDGPAGVGTVRMVWARADSAWVRAGADRARLEGVFALSDDQRALLQPVLDEYGLTEAAAESDDLILTREITAAGRSTGRVNGRAVTAAILGAVGEALVDIHGQSEHLSLLRVRQHIELLDRYAGLGAPRAAWIGGARKVRSPITGEASTVLCRVSAPIARWAPSTVM